MAKRYRKSEAVKMLEDLAFQKKKERLTMPEYAIVRPKYSDKDANGLTACIVDYINFQPTSMAWRVNNMGVYDSKLGKYRNPGTRKGIADISAIRDGQAWQIEVKKGSDKLSEHQDKFKQDVERARGVYCVAYSFEQFLTRWKTGTAEKMTLF